MHKKLSFFLALVLIISVFTPNMSFASRNNYYLQAAKYLNEQGVLKGSTSGNLLLEESLKRQDMIVMISRLYGKENQAKSYPNKNYFSDINSTYYKGFISWAVDNNLVIGVSKNLFGYDRKVRVQEYQAILLRALSYDEESKDWENVPKLANKLGIMDNINISPSSEAKRDVMSAMTLNTLYIKPKNEKERLGDKLGLKLPLRFNVESEYFINKDKLTIKGRADGTDNLTIRLINKDNPRIKIEREFPISDKGKFEVQFKGLISGRYEYSFSNNNETIMGKELEIKEPPLKLENIEAPNLKEIHINFNNPIKRNLLLNKDKIKTNAGKISNIRFEDRDKKLILVLDNDSQMNNYKKYSIELPLIESKAGQRLENLVYSFIAKDEVNPYIKEIIPLGNKRLKLILSEPVRHPSNYNFKIDGKKFNGRIQNKENTISLIFPTNSPLEKGQHKLEVSKLEDYFGNTSNNLNNFFEIKDDNKKLELVECNAHIDEIIFEFNKDIDPEFLGVKDFYWRIGRRKIYPDFLEVNGNTIRIVFNGKDTLPLHETPIYTSNVKDFYGNILANPTIRVTATVNTSQPKIKNLELSEDKKSIIINFNKRVIANKLDSYTLRNSKNEVIKLSSVESSPRKSILNLYSPLTEDSYKLIVENIEDALNKNNLLIKDELEFTIKDKEKPKVKDYAKNKEKVLISFTKDMDLNTITNPSNYLIKVNNSWRYLPKDTLFETVENNKTLIINIPKNIGKPSVNLSESGGITELQLIGLKSTNGDLMEPTVLDLTNCNDSLLKAEKAKLINKNTIEVEFNQKVLSASPNDFYISDKIWVDKINFDDYNKLSLKLSENISSLRGNYLTILDNNSIENTANTQAQADKLEVEDLTPPFIITEGNLKIKDASIEIEFSEELDQEISSAFKRDIVIEKISGSQLEKVDFSTSSEDNILKIKLNDYKPGNKYKISFAEKPLIIMDKEANILDSSDKIFIAY